ncbi:MAG TPA: helix-turn-helix domain-containing protein [Gemmataceae bacterium]|nr:helix-turn-helix domain-containing protein [Gemmataceae bacterium]
MHTQGTALPGGQGATGHGLAGESGRIAYTVAEVAALLGKHINTVYDWVKAGALPAERIGGTIYIPKWALGRLLAPDAGAPLTVATAPAGGEAA